MNKSTHIHCRTVHILQTHDTMLNNVKDATDDNALQSGTLLINRFHLSQLSILSTFLYLNTLMNIWGENEVVLMIN